MSAAPSGAVPATVPGVAQPDRWAQARLAFTASRYEEAQALALGLYEEAQAANQPALMADMALLLAKVHANRGHHAQARDWAERAAAAAESTPGELESVERKAQAWALVASECARGDQPGPSMVAVGHVLPLLTQLREPRVLSVVFTGLTFTYMNLCMPEQALAAARRALAAALQLEDEGVRVRCTVNLVQAGLDSWDLLAGADSPQGQGHVALLDELRAQCQWLHERWRALPDQDEGMRASWVELLCRVQVRAGERAEARALLEAQLQRHWQGNPAMHRDLWIDLARVQQADGDTDAARASAERAVAEHGRVNRPPRTSELPYLAAMAELQGHTGQALATVREHQRRTQRMVLGALQARVDELSSQLQAQALRLENADLKSRNEGLTASVQEISQLAATDALTGLLNRRAVASLWPQAAQQVGAVALLDIDHFKRINDSHSHAVGDAVLREMAQLMSHALRQPDHLGRWGGEEFIAVLTGLPLQAAVVVLERLCERVQAHDWAHLAPGLHVTVSVGLTELQPGEALASAVARADTLLYRAKREGRNRVVWAAAVAG